jgi:hypothetical protein
VKTPDTESRKFWTARRILTSVGCMPWAYLVWSGYDLCYGSSVHPVPGYPNQGQVHLYVVAPIIGLLISIAAYVVANRIPTWAAALAFCVEFLALFPLIALWGGGI